MATARTVRGAVVIVTGASSGIGAETARELARRGALVALAARRVEELADVERAIQDAGGQALAMPTDVMEARAVARLVERTVEVFGQVDVVVNNAGIGARLRYDQLAFEEIARIVQVNLLGAMLVSRAALPGMLERHHGAIISVASVAGLIATDPAYSATKFGLRGFALGLRRELRGTGVSVSLVSPGFIRTPLTAGRRGSGRLPGPEIVARAIARLIEHPRREAVVPSYYRGAIWAERLLPFVADRVLGGRR